MGLAFSHDDVIFSKPWWTVRDVARYLTLLKSKPISDGGARTFMRRARVQRAADCTLTKRAWVDQALTKGRRG
jgi:hypothetical protein